MRTQHPFWLALLAWLSGCGGHGAALGPITPQAVLPGFEPARFTDPERRARIEAVLPEIRALFERNARDHHYPGHAFGVLVDGELVLADGVGFVNLETREPVTADSEFHIASMTKSFTSMAILKLRDEGELSLQDSVVDYLPEIRNLRYPTSDSPPITLANLMTMSSGFPEDNPWADRHLEDSDAEFMAFLEAGLSMSTVPSTGYEYSNLGYGMLGTIITRVAGRPYQDYITDEILAPLGMNETYWEYEDVPADRLAQGYLWQDGEWIPEPMLHTGAFGAIGGLITSIHDFGKYVAFHMSAWPAHSGPDDGPVKRSTLREMHSPTHLRLSPDAKDASGAPCPSMRGYGYGLIARTDCRGVRRIEHTGGLPGFGSNYQFFPDHGVAILSFSNHRYGASRPAHEAVGQLLFEKAQLPERVLPISDTLRSRVPQVVELMKTWDMALGDEILADNFYLDEPRELRMASVQKLLQEAGPILSVDPIVPVNQLRGTFVIRAMNQDLRVFFTLSPEREARVQRLDVRLQDK
ncbi:Penicillin-binding protein 4* [Planctomycetes bacterium Poly30]|uniref:Penicillin-binding protein 4 n=1 Tax=Saltatorellus ferox TaxID=2528018 RepID=A0A518EQN4_9BACT|nr:Penicillin-binding protein 4* [Planctomycetes bacterium Poly30]